MLILVLPRRVADPERPRQEHNQGEGAAWTARRLPVEIAWTGTHDSLSSARTRENQLKRWSRAKEGSFGWGFPSTGLRTGLKACDSPASIILPVGVSID